MKAIILGATSGIGRSIAQNLKGTCKKVISLGSKDVNTSSLKSVKNFCKKYYGPDVLVLNTGGPPDLEFNKINNDLWIENFNKLFLSFSNIIKDVGIKKNGYVFLISSYIIKQPSNELIISSSLRSGFNSLFKSLSIIYAKKNIKFINIAPGPIKTKRLINLLKKDGLTLRKFEKQILGNKIPEASEIGKFVNFVVKNKIISLNGNTITFDSNLIKGL
jgi:3-oxoacyl-[acyl-carrier protein] reductase